MRWCLLGWGHKEPGNPGPSLWTCHSPGGSQHFQHGGSPRAVVMGSERGAEDTGASVRDAVPSWGHRGFELLSYGHISRDLCHLQDLR
jgi:hypothetical protein